MLEELHRLNVKMDIGAFGMTEHKHTCNVYQIKFYLLSLTVMAPIVVKKQKKDSRFFHWVYAIQV